MDTKELLLQELENRMTAKELKLFRLLSEKDDTGVLARQFLGIVHVLNDPLNPDRYAQAANSIRGIADRNVPTN